MSIHVHPEMSEASSEFVKLIDSTTESKRIFRVYFP